MDAEFFYATQKRENRRESSANINNELDILLELLI